MTTSNHKIIRCKARRAVMAQGQGDELRAGCKSRDDLQAVQRMLKETDIEVALQFTKPPVNHTEPKPVVTPIAPKLSPMGNSLILPVRGSSRPMPFPETSANQT